MRCAVGGLSFNSGVPPRIEMNHGVRCREAEPNASRLQADEKERYAFILLKAVDDFLPVSCEPSNLQNGISASSSVPEMMSSIAVN